MANGGNIEFGIGFNVDKSALIDLQSQLKGILSMDALDLKLGSDSTKPIEEIKKGLQEAQSAATTLDRALENAFNNDLGTLNVTKFQQSLTNAGTSLSSLYRQLQGAGDAGVSAFRNITTQVLTANTYLKQSDKIIAKMAETLGNTIKWNISSSAVNNLSGAIQQAWGFTKALDGSLNDIQIVTSKSSEDMKKFAIQANDAAKALGTTTTAYTDAALTFYQQGLSDEDVAARAETSLKVSNVTGLSGDQSAEYVTAVLNGYKVAAAEAEQAMDKLAAVGAHTASSLAELSEAMAKVSSSANAMGVSEDQLAATLATVISVTRQDASTVGTAFKTIYARISDIKAGSEDAEVSLGNYTKKMAEMGFSVLDSAGNMRDLGEVMEEIGGKWETLTKEQQISLAQTMAGTRQYNNLIALFDNWAQYEDALNVSMKSSGTLQEQQEIYAESLTAKLNELTAAKEGLYNSFIDSDSMKSAIEVFTKLVQVMDNFIQGIGGGGNALLGFGAILVKVFSKQIANSISTVITNVGHLFDKLDQTAAKQRLVAEWKASGQSDAVVDKLIAKYDTLQNKLSNLTAEQYNAAMEMLKTQSQAEDSANQWDEATKAAQDYIKAVTGIDVNILDENNNIKELNKDEQYEVEYKLKNAKDKYNEDTGETDTANELVRLTEERKKVEQEIQKLRDKKDSGEITEKEQKRLQALRVNLRSIKQEMKEVDKTTQEFSNDLSKIAQEDLDIIDDKEAKQEINDIINELQTKLSQYDGLNMSDIIDDTDIQTLSEKLTKALASAGQGLDDKIQDILNQISSASALEGEGLHEDVKKGDKKFEDDINAMELQAKVQSITELTSAVMSLGSAYSTIQNLGSIWSNDDLEITQKLGQTLGALVGIFTTVTTAIATLSKTKLGEQLITKLLNAEWMKQILVNQGVAVSEGEVTMATLTLEGALVPLLVVVLSVTAAMAGLALAAAGINKLLNLSVDANKQAAAEAQALADAEHEKTEVLREQKEAIDAIIDGYQELYGQYKSGQITLEELRQKTYDLCMQYGQEDLALKALIADQEELNNLMKEAQSKTDSELYNQSKKEAGYDKDAIKRGIMADAGKREDSFGYGKSTIDLKGMGARNTKEIDFAEELEKVGINFENDDHISTDSLVEAYTENYDELMEVLSKYSDLDAAAQIGEYLDNQKDNLDNYKDAVDTEQQLFLENELKSRYDENEGFKEGQNFHKATTESAEAAANEKYGARTEENAEDWDAYYEERLEAARNFYAQYSELAHDAMAEEINESLAKNKIVTKDMQLTQEQFEYLYLHLDTAEAYNNLNDFFKDYEKDINIANTKSVLLDLDTQLADEDKEAFTDEELASYFGLEGFEEQINMSLEQIKGIDFQDQKIALMAASQQMKADLISSYQESIKAQQEATQEIENKLSDSEVKHNSFLKNRYEQFFDNFGVGPQEALTQLEAYEQKSAEIQSKYNTGEFNYDKYTEALDGLDNEYQAVVKLKEQYGDLDKAKNAITSDNNGEDSYSYLETEQELLELQKQGIELSDIDTVQDLNAQQDALNENIQNNKAEVESLKQAIIDMNKTAADSAQSLRDLNDLKEQGAFVDIEGTTVDEGKAAYNERAGELYEAARMEGLDSEEVRDYAHSLKDVSDNSEILSDDLKDNLEDCQDLAIQIKRMNKGVDTLEKNWKDWSDILKKSSKESEEYADAMTGSKEAMADLLDVTEEFISDDFITDNMEDIAKAAEGDADAIDRLRAAMLKDIVMHLDLDDSSLNNEQLLARVQDLQGMLDINSLEVGAEVDDAAFIEACNKLITDAGLTKDQVNAMFSGMGFDVNYAEEDQPTETRIPEYETHTVAMKAGTYTAEDGKVYEDVIQRTWTEPVGEHVYEGTIPAAGLVTTIPGETATPKINSVTKKAGGGMNNKSSSNPGGGKKGGGGGGGSKPKEPDKMDKSNDEIDRYHDINIALKQLETQYDRLGKAQDKLIGKDLINNLNQQLKILEKQKQTLAQKIELERQEAAELQGDLAKEGVKFNDDGTIANYADVLKAKEDYVNSLIEKYNGMSAEEQETYKETVEKAKKDYEKLKENIDRYDTVITDEIPGLEDQIQDIVDQEIEINVKKFTMGIELRLEMKEAEQDWNKFKRKIIDGMKDDNIFGQGLESLENYRDYFDLGGGQGGTVDALTKQVNNTMTEIQKMQAGEISNIFGNDMSKAMETLTTYNSELMTQLEDMEDLVESIEQGLLDTMDEVKEKMDAQVEAYEYVNDLLESDMELVQMLYGEDSYEALGNYYAQKHENYKQALDFDKQEVAFWQQEMEAAKASGNEETYQKALENYREGVNKLNEDVKASVQNIIDSYSNTINQIFDKLDKKMSGKTGGMDSLREEWELINTNADRYLDTINSTYEVQKLQNKYKTSINTAESTKVQQKLNALMEEEIGMLEKKDKLSQYDIDRANMKYDIALKQIALEEAQQNKSSMRMKRDAQGNYSYVYAGDEDDISSKTQELADAQNQLYNLDKDQYRQNMDDIVSYTAEMQEKIKELYEDPTMDPEVRGEREKTIREQYGELINNIIADNESIRANLHESTFDSLSMLYETDEDNFRTMTGLENDDWSNMTDDMLNNIQTKMIPTWDGSVQHMIDTFIADGGIGPTIDQVFKDADEALKNYESSLSEVEAAAGISFDAIKSGTDAASESAKELIGDNNEIMDQCKEQVEEYKALIAQVKDLATAYDGVRDAAIRAANAAHTLAEEINNQSVSAADDPTIGPNMPSPSGPSADPNGPGGNPTNPASGNGSGDGVLNVGDEVTYTGGKYYEDSYGGGKSGERGPGKKVKVTIIKDDGRPYPIHVESSDSAYGWLKKEQLSGFKSGGFTGSWQGGIDRDDGRLALLHQKELVLNADDTDNFLKAMQDLRKAQNEIKTVSSSGVISAMFNSISDAITAKMQNLQSAQADILNAKGPAGGGLTGTIQNITINADFPEVSDANEIRKAFDQIIGMASQKASNKSR